MRRSLRWTPGGFLTSLAVVLGLSAILVLLDGISLGANSKEHAESRGQERWHLSWNVVDRGLASWGEEGEFSSLDDCLAAEKKAVRRKAEELRSLGNDVAEHRDVIIEKSRVDEMVLTVVHFFCSEERDWTILVAQHSRKGTVTEDRIGLFQTEELCIDALELEVDFKTKSLRNLGNHVSAVRSVTNWTLTTTEAFGVEAGQTETSATYQCVPK